MTLAAAPRRGGGAASRARGADGRRGSRRKKSGVGRLSENEGRLTPEATAALKREMRSSTANVPAHDQGLPLHGNAETKRSTFRFDDRRAVAAVEEAADDPHHLQANLPRGWGLR